MQRKWHSLPFWSFSRFSASLFFPAFSPKNDKDEDWCGWWAIKLCAISIISTERLPSLVWMVPDWKAFHCVSEHIWSGSTRFDRFLEERRDTIASLVMCPLTQTLRLFSVKKKLGKLYRKVFCNVFIGLQLESSQLFDLCSDFSHQQWHLPTPVAILGAEMIFSL